MGSDGWDGRIGFSTSLLLGCLTANAAMDIASIMDGFGRCHGSDRTSGSGLNGIGIVISGWT